MMLLVLSAHVDGKYTFHPLLLKIVPHCMLGIYFFILFLIFMDGKIDARDGVVLM